MTGSQPREPDRPAEDRRNPWHRLVGALASFVGGLALLTLLLVVLLIVIIVAIL